jgi:peptide/nickel transport system permease protein
MLLYLKKYKAMSIGGIIVMTVGFMALFAPILAPYSPSDHSSSILEAPSLKHFFGTDEYGRDVFSLIIWGSRITLTVAISSLLIGAIIGIIWGIIGGYARGTVHSLLNSIIDILLSYPSLMIALFVLALYGESGKETVIVAIGITLSPRFARVIRGATLPLREEDFILAANAQGASTYRIIRYHLLPNLVGPISVLISVYLPFVIILESSLSFIGVGMPPDVATWGRILSDGRSYLQLAPWIALFSGIAITITTIGFNVIGDGLRDFIDPKARSVIQQKYVS